MYSPCNGIQCADGLGFSLEAAAELRSGNFERDDVIESVSRALYTSPYRLRQWRENFV